MTKRKDAMLSEADRRAPFALGAVTSENYQQRCAEFIKRSAEPAKGRMIYNADGAKAKEQDETPERWVAWIAYLYQLGQPPGTAYAMKHGFACVPAKYPWDFSVDAAPIEGRLSDLLRGYKTIPQKRSRPLFDHNERTKDSEVMRRHREHQAENRRVEDQERLAAAAERGEWLRQKDEEKRLLSFIEAGIEPPEVPEGGIGMSYGMMLHLGWTVVQDCGRNVMLPPSLGTWDRPVKKEGY